jgi:tetratricopeptide (TPR) repeat protein
MLRSMRTSAVNRAPTDAGEGYSLRDVGKLLGLPRSMVCGLIEAGFVSPARGRRREYRFSFQDLVVLRTAQALVQAKLPTTRILRSLRRLRSQLPPQIPLSGLRVEAVGDAVVVREGSVQWQTHDGQYLLRFHVDSPGGRLAFLDASPPAPALSADQLFERGMAREEADPAEACALYQQAITAEPTHISSYTNLGRLLHERKQLSKAEAKYREGLARCGRDATLFFNLAILLEDLRRPRDAADMYRAALAENPDLPEAHYNLALLCEAAGLQQEAIRHFAAFRRLDRK